MPTVRRFLTLSFIAFALAAASTTTVIQAYSATATAAAGPVGAGTTLLPAITDFTSDKSGHEGSDQSTRVSALIHAIGIAPKGVPSRAEGLAAYRAEQAALRGGPIDPRAGRLVAQADDVAAAGRSFDPNQAALVDIAKQARRTGVSPQEARILGGWSQEYGLPFRGPEIHPGRAYGQFPHIHVGPVDHIPVIDP